MNIIDGIPVFGTHDDTTLQQMRNVAQSEHAVATALMADGHLGYGMPIGGVVAYDNAISPGAVGFDIACGNKAVKTDLHKDDVAQAMKHIMDLVYSKVAFGIGSCSGLFADHEIFDLDHWNDLDIAKQLKEQARSQLGSVGSGNHYVDIFHDQDGVVWVGVHFGSRGFGHKLTTHFLKALGAKDVVMEAPVTVSLDQQVGQDYLFGMNLAGKYAYAGRDMVCQQVCDIIGANIVDEIHNHHNFAWKESHFGQDVIVVRKGATPAEPGQRGFVGGSMGDNAVILEGAPAAENQAAAMYSTVHGAGRVMSRSKAKGRWKKGAQVKKGLVDPLEMKQWLKRANVILKGGGLDEAPQAYRRLSEVLLAQGQTVKVTHILKPMGVAMAGSKDFDPFKD